MNILMISRGYPSKKYPMNGIFEYDQAKALSDYGHNVIYGFVDLRSIRRVRKFGFEKFEKDGILHYGVNIPLGRFPRKILSFFSYYGIKKLYNKIEKEYGRPDIIHAHFTGPAYSAARLKGKISLPLVVTEHSSKIMSKNIDIELFDKAKFAYNMADKVISVSPAFRDIIRKKFDISSKYIPNIVDTDLFNPNYKNNYDKKFNFVSVGNLIKGKGMDLTIKAFNNSFSNNQDVSLTIIGGGPELKNLKSLVNEYNLSERINFTERIDRSGVADYLNCSDCFVLASKSETFGVAYIEAMASGLPVIATKCGGPEHFIDEDQGIVIEVDNLNELTKAMNTMYDNIDDYDSEIISRKTIREFSPENVSTKITKVYAEIV